MAELHVLHVVPRWHMGGPPIGMVLEAEHARASGNGLLHRVLALEPGAATPMLRAAMRAGLRVQLALPRDEEAALLAWADAIVVHWWNAPSMRRFFDRHRGCAMRWVPSVHVNGLHPPQRVPPAFGRAASQVVLTSPHARGLLQAAGPVVCGARPAVHVVPAPARLQMVPGGLDERPGRSIVHVGTLNVFKLSPAFVPLHAHAARADAPIIVVGTGGDEARFQAEAEALGVAAGLRWVGFVDDVPRIHDGARLMSYPMARLAYGSSDRTVQEAQACGVPVLLPRSAPLAHLVREGLTGLLADDDEDFERIVTAVAKDAWPLPPRRRVREVALEDHDPAPKLRKLADVWREAAERPPGVIDDGHPDLDSWMHFQVGDVAELVDMRRPALAALRDDAVLARHQRWACEGGLAHYLKAFGEEAVR